MPPYACALYAESASSLQGLIRADKQSPHSSPSDITDHPVRYDDDQDDISSASSSPTVASSTVAPSASSDKSVSSASSVMADAKTQIDSVIAAATARAYEDSLSTSDDDDNNAAQHTAAEHVDDSSDEDDMMDDPYLSSSPSIYDESDINYDLVYALHTFRATQKGHADALKGDAMIMLDDTNEYWWLVRMMKDSSVGYLPAEHIETPTERLARLNKHRNTEPLVIEPAAPTRSASDKSTGSTSRNPLKRFRSKRQTSAAAAAAALLVAENAKNTTPKSVSFTDPTFYDPPEGYFVYYSDDGEMGDEEGSDSSDSESENEEKIDEDEMADDETEEQSLDMVDAMEDVNNSSEDVSEIVEFTPVPVDNEEPMMYEGETTLRESMELDDAQAPFTEVEPVTSAVAVDSLEAATPAAAADVELARAASQSSSLSLSPTSELVDDHVDEEVTGDAVSASLSLSPVVTPIDDVMTDSASVTSAVPSIHVFNPRAQEEKTQLSEAQDQTQPEVPVRRLSHNKLRKKDPNALLKTKSSLEKLSIRHRSFSNNSSNSNNLNSPLHPSSSPTSVGSGSSSSSHHLSTGKVLSNIFKRKSGSRSSFIGTSSSSDSSAAAASVSVVSATPATTDAAPSVTSSQSGFSSYEDVSPVTDAPPSTSTPPLPADTKLMPPPSVTAIMPEKSSSLRVVTSTPMGQSASEGAAVASSPFESMFTRRSRTTTHDSMCSDTSTTIMQPFGEYEMVHDDRESIVSSGFGGAQEPSVATTVYEQVGESDASSVDEFGGNRLGATATIDEVENEDMTTPRVKQTEQYHPQPQQQPRSSSPASPSLRKIASDLTDATTTTTTTQDDTYYSATNLLAGYEDSRSNSSVTVATADLASGGGLPRSSARSSVGMGGGNARSSVASDFDEAHTGRGLLLLQTYAARQQNEQQQQQHECQQREPAALEKLRSLPEDQSASVIGLGFVPVDKPQSSSSSSASVSPSKPQVPASRPIPKSRSGSASSSSDRKRLSTLDNNNPTTTTTRAMPPPQYIPTRRFIHHSLLPSYQRSMQDLDLASGKLDDLLAQWWERNSPVASPAMMQPGTPTPNMV